MNVEPPESGERGSGESVVDFAYAHQDVYLRSYLEPFRAWLEQDDVSEILVNRPGEAWIERAGQPAMQRMEAPRIDDVLLRRLATQVARVSHQAINREHPLLAATAWRLDASLDGLRAAVAARKTILISGGTSSGKTTFLNALLKEVPSHERIVTVEDTPEINVSRPNCVSLVAVRGEQGEAKVGTDDLLQASLRLRPDRIILGEVRGPEAVTFLRAINTGHPGSFTTIHANTPAGALEQLALMAMQAGIGLARADTLAYIRSLVDVVVQLGRVDGQRQLLAIEGLH